MQGTAVSSRQQLKGSTISATGISSIWFGVTDWLKAKNFYEEVLGLHPGFVNDAAGWASSPNRRSAVDIKGTLFP